MRASAARIKWRGSSAVRFMLRIIRLYQELTMKILEIGLSEKGKLEGICPLCRPGSLPGTARQGMCRTRLFSLAEKRQVRKAEPALQREKATLCVDRLIRVSGL